MSTRESFVEHFGEENARAIEHAAEDHMGYQTRRGSDEFRWAICIVIGHECVSVYAEHHGITCSPEDFKAWCLEHGDLPNHDGEIDVLALFGGVYNEYMTKPEEETL